MLLRPGYRGRKGNCMIKIAAAAYVEFDRAYWNGEFQTQRWGQAFINFFDLGPDPQLFYEASADMARADALDRYVE